MTKKSITVLLQELKTGDQSQLDEVYAMLYNDIKSIAHKQICLLNTGQTITPTVIANECYIKLSKRNDIQLKDRRHFLNYLAKSMRMLLIDIMRAKSSIKRQHITAHQSYTLIEGQKDVDFDLIEIDLLLTKIAKIKPQYCEVLEHKLLFNLTFKEISDITEKSERQVMRIWKQAVTLITALATQGGKAQQN